jgi:Ca2+-binding EF-hand superfamily protein
MIPTKQDLEALFSIYDRDNSGSIDYKEFSSSLYGRPMTASSTGGNGGARAPEELAEAMRQKLASRGARGFVGLQR